MQETHEVHRVLGVVAVGRLERGAPRVALGLSLAVLLPLTARGAVTLLATEQVEQARRQRGRIERAALRRRLERALLISDGASAVDMARAWRCARSLAASPRHASLAEDRGPHAHVRRAFLDGHLEVRAHPHGEPSPFAELRVG